MPQRKVIGQLLDISGNPKTKASVMFRLRYHSDEMIGLPREKTVKTDDDGNFEAVLWCNEAGKPPPTYSVCLGGVMFDFHLLPGAEPLEPFRLTRASAAASLGIGTPAVVPTATDRREILQAIAGQTVFNLQYTCSDPEQSYLAINGVQARYNIDYTIQGATLLWQGGYALDAGDSIEIAYPGW